MEIMQSQYLNSYRMHFLSHRHAPSAKSSFLHSCSPRRILERLNVLDPANVLGQRDLSVLHARIGEALQAKGDLAPALTRFRTAIAIQQRLASADPTNSEWQRDVSVSLVKIAEILDSQGSRDEALARYREGLALAERIAAGDPKNADRQRDLLTLHRSGTCSRRRARLPQR
jgi:tetratricopeptide (TPR) repeat protein